MLLSGSCLHRRAKGCVFHKPVCIVCLGRSKVQKCASARLHRESCACTSSAMCASTLVHEILKWHQMIHPAPRITSIGSYVGLQGLDPIVTIVGLQGQLSYNGV
eukprot:1160658-Pelagomonas_calceolata.AAC.12